jgi:hypothetical protein
MRRTFPPGIALLVMHLATSSAPGDEWNIRWKAFDKASGPFYQVLTTRTTQVMTVLDSDVKQHQEQTFIVKWTPLDKDSKGNRVVRQRIIGIKMDIDISGKKISFDSTDNSAPKNPMTEFFEALTSMDLKFHINPADLSVQQIEGREEIIQNLSKTNPKLEELLKNILSEPALKQMAQASTDLFPTETDRKGWTDDRKTWKRERLLDLGPIGQYKTEQTFTWNEKHRIKIKSKITYQEPPDKNAKAKLPFAIKEGNLSGTDLGNAYAVFDRNKGRFREIRIATALKGTLKIEIDGKETTVKLHQTQESSSESFDENPLTRRE